MPDQSTTIILTNGVDWFFLAYWCFAVAAAIALVGLVVLVWDMIRELGV